MTSLPLDTIICYFDLDLMTSISTNSHLLGIHILTVKFYPFNSYLSDKQWYTNVQTDLWKAIYKRFLEIKILLKQVNKSPTFNQIKDIKM